MIDKEGNGLDKIILNRMLRHTEDINGLWSNQYGFQKGKSTVDAILSVTKTAEMALQHKKRKICYCAGRDNKEDQKDIRFSSGVRKVSIKGWNAMYDKVLIIGFAGR